MTNFIRTVAAFAVVVLSSSAAMAQETAAAATTPLINLTGAFGAGLVTIGAAAGIARLAASAVESMARQPKKSTPLSNSPRRNACDSLGEILRSSFVSSLLQGMKLSSVGRGPS